MYCHGNTSNMEKWGISPTSKANIINREDHSSLSSNVNCYDCHVDTRSTPQTFHAEELNAGTGSSPDCLGCHNITGAYAKIEFGCKQCHAVGGEGGSSGMEYGNAISVPVNHNLMGSNGVFCKGSCHNSNPAVNITNHHINMGLYVGASACYATGCHILQPCEECTR